MRQDGGESSTNYQAGGDITFQGVSYSEARQIALDLFEVKRRELVREAAETAEVRVGELVTDFIERLRQDSPESINTLRDPDMQFTLGSAEVAYARSGDKGLEELLVDLLLKRAQTPSRSLLQVVLNEAISVVPKLIDYHWNTLSLIFTLKYTINNTLTNVNNLQNYFSKYIAPLLHNVSKENACFQHLEYAGCATNTVLVHSLEEHYFLTNYSGLFSKGISPNSMEDYYKELPSIKGLFLPCLHNGKLFQVNAMNENVIKERVRAIGGNEALTSRIITLHKESLMKKEEVRSLLLTLLPCASELFDYWDSSMANRMQLTSVGITLGNVNMKRQFGEMADLTIWIK